MAIVFFVGAAGVYFGYINTAIEGNKALRAEIATQQKSFDNIRQIEDKKKKLIAANDSISAEDHARLEKMVPNTVDTVRLVSDLYDRASKNQVEMKRVDLKKTAASVEGNSIGPDDAEYSALDVSMIVSGTYPRFMNFLTDMERSLRVIDVTSVSVNAPVAGKPTPGVNPNAYEYQITARTYFMKQQQ